jgi:hypothetical protein
MAGTIDSPVQSKEPSRWADEVVSCRHILRDKPTTHPQAHEGGCSNEKASCGRKVAAIIWIRSFN